MTTLVLSRNSATNTTLSHQDGTTAYMVKTEFKWKNQVTGISTPDGAELARFNRKTFHEDTVTMGGQEMKLSELMRQSKSFTSSNRHFTNKSGEQFEWKIDRKLYCIAAETGACVATYHRSSWGIFSKKSPAYIDLSEKVVDHDLFTVTWMIMENIRTWRESILYGGGGWYLMVNPP